MKLLIKAVALAAVLTAPAVSFAQSDQPVARAQVRAELAALEKVGYNPVAEGNADYPRNIQAAVARLAVQNSAEGGVTSGSSQAGNTAAAQ